MLVRLGVAGVEWELEVEVVGVVVVVVYARVAGELVGAREALLAAGEGALEWFLAGVRADVARL